MNNNGQRWKVALIPVLVAVLGYVLWNKLAVSSESDRAAPPAKLESRRTKPDSKLQKRNDLARPTEFSTHNPFLPLGTTSKAPVQDDRGSDKDSHDQVENDGTDLPARQPELGTVEAIFRDGAGVAALVGDRVLRVGDTVADDYRVESIAEDGVRLQRIRE